MATKDSLAAWLQGSDTLQDRQAVRDYLKNLGYAESSARRMAMAKTGRANATNRGIVSEAYNLLAGNKEVGTSKLKSALVRLGSDGDVAKIARRAGGLGKMMMRVSVKVRQGAADAMPSIDLPLEMGKGVGASRDFLMEDKAEIEAWLKDLWPRFRPGNLVQVFFGTYEDSGEVDEESIGWQGGRVRQVEGAAMRDLEWSDLEQDYLAAINGGTQPDEA